MEKPKTNKFESAEDMTKSGDKKVDAVQKRTRDRVFHSIGNIVEFTADTGNFIGRATGYGLGAITRGTVDGVKAVIRGAKKQPFHQSA